MANDYRHIGISPMSDKNHYVNFMICGYNMRPLPGHRTQDTGHRTQGMQGTSWGGGGKNGRGTHSIDPPPYLKNSKRVIGLGIPVGYAPLEGDAFEYVIGYDLFDDPAIFH